MAKFIGRNELINSLNKIIRIEDKRGIEGEIRVGDELSKQLPQEVNIISQPEIGHYQPDFLILSENLGFRIIEVKNYSIENINKVHSNGTLVIGRNKRINPLEQVKKHVDGLSSYILSNHSSIKDPYKLIGYCIVHVGFDKVSFEQRFKQDINHWSAEQKRNFFRHHIFIDELKQNIMQRLADATRFSLKNEYVLTNEFIQEMVSSIKIGDYQPNNEVIESLNSLNDSVQSLKEEIQSISQVVHSKNDFGNIHPTRHKKSGKWLLGLIILFLIIGISYYISISLNGGSNDLIITDLSQLDNKEKNSLISIQAKVSRFIFDEASGTKFLILTDGKNEMNAIIFKNTKVPFIAEGHVYVFEGELQEYNGEIELKVNHVDEQ